MRRLPFALLLVLVGGLSASVAQERRVFVLTPTKGAQLLDQCSRRTPQGVEGFWTPAPRDVTELEALLDKFLRTDSAGRSVLPLDQYHRQYIGFTKSGKRFIYGNFYRAPSAISSTYDEGTQPVIVCDGGPRFWGIVYSAEARSFMDLAFNGVA